MARTSRKKNAKDSQAAAPSLERLSADRPRRRAPALLWTLLAALLAPVLVFVFLAYQTSSSGGPSIPLTRWSVGDATSISDPDVLIENDGIVLPVGPRHVILRGDIPAGANPTRLRFDFLIERPLRPNLRVLSHNPKESSTTTYDLSTNHTFRTGKNTLQVSVDESTNLAGADAVGIEVWSPEGENRIGIAHVYLDRAGFIARLGEMWQCLLNPEVLNRGSNNFATAPLVAGHGAPYIAWMALALALLLLAIRRWALGAGFSFPRHALATLLALFVICDLHNGVDEVAQARLSISRRVQFPKETDYFAKLEDSEPWFAGVLGYVDALPEDRPYFLRVLPLPGQDAARRRLIYYAMPHRSVEDPKDADVALVQNGMGELEADPRWKHASELPGGIVVYELQQPRPPEKSKR